MDSSQRGHRVYFRKSQIGRRRLLGERLEPRLLLAAEVEPNGTLAEATSFTVMGSEVLSGEIATLGDVDVFKTTLTYGQQMWVDPSNTTNASFNPKLPPPVEILDVHGDVKSASRGHESTSFIAPSDGTYYIRFNSDLAYGDFVDTYAPTVMIENYLGLTESEPNDGITSTDTLVAPNNFRGSLASTSDIDVFTLSITMSKTIVVQFSDAPVNNPSVRLFDMSGNLVASELTGLGLRAEVSTAGTYSVQLGSDNLAGYVTGQYVGYVSVEDHTVWSESPSDRFEVASDWQIDSLPTYVIGNLTSVSDADYYTFESKGLDFLRFDLGGYYRDKLSFQNRRITVYNEFGQPLQYSTNGSLDTQDNSRLSQPGRFYISVEATSETGLGSYAMSGQITSTFSPQRDVPLSFIDFDEQEPHFGYEWLEPYSTPAAIPFVVGRFDALYDIYDMDVSLIKPAEGTERLSSGIGDFGDINAGGWGGGGMGVRRPDGNSVISVTGGLSSFQGGGVPALLHESGHAIGLPHARNVEANMAYDSQVELNPPGSFYPFRNTDSRIAQSIQINQRDYLDWVTQPGRQITEAEPNDDRYTAERLDPFFDEMRWELDPRTTYDVTEGISSIVSGDFNGDGKTDVATASFDDDKVRVLLGQSDGTLGTVAAYDTGDLDWRFEPLAVGDFNGDHRDDLVTANFVDLDISILLANEDGSFQNASRIGLGQYAYAPAVADLNGDNKMDIAVTAGAQLFVLLGNGDGSFQSPIVYTTGYALSLVAADFSGDGCPDLAMASHSVGGAVVLINKGNGTFDPAVNYITGGNSYSIAAADFDSDNKIDLAVADRNERKTTILRGDGEGSFQNVGDISLDFEPLSIQAADIDGDGISDLSYGAFTDSVDVRLGKGDGTFSECIHYTTGSSSLSVVAADFNGDSLPDLATANRLDRSVDVLLGRENDVRNDRVVVHGKIASPHDADFYQLNVDAGQTYVFDIDSAEFQYPLDAIISLYDSTDQRLDTNAQARDGDTGLSSVDPYLVHTFAQSGVITLRVTGERNTVGNYRLKVTPGEALDQDGPRVLYALPEQGARFDSTRQLLFWLDDQLDPDTLTNENIIVRGNTSGIMTGTSTFDPLSSLLIWVADNPLPVDLFTVTLKSGPGGIMDLKGNVLDGETDGMFTLPDVSGDGTAGGDFTTSFTVTGTDTTPASVSSVSYRRHPYNRGLFRLLFSDKLDATHVQSADFVLRGAGHDELLDTPDDRFLPLDVWYDTYRYSYSSSQLYAYSRGIPDVGTYRIEAVILDAAGHAINLSQQVSVDPSPIHSGPSVIDVNIQPGSVAQSKDFITVDFSSSVDPASLTTSNFTLRYSSDPLFFNGDDSMIPDADGVIPWDPIHQRATFQPVVSLPEGYYLLELNGDAEGITDLQGRRMDGEFLDSFIQGNENTFLWQDAPSGDGQEGGDYLASFSIQNDMPGVTVTPTVGLITTETGTVANFTMVLNSEPTADVTISLASSDPSEGTVSTSSVTFTSTNWNTPQTVTITGVDDFLADDNVRYTIITAAATSIDAEYAGMNVANVAVTNWDNDVNPPVANPGGPYVGSVETPITFDGSASTDDVGIVRYEWDFDYQLGFFNVDTTGVLVSRSFEDVFTERAIALRVTDTNGLVDVQTSSLKMAPSLTLDVDGNCKTDALTDGIVILRYLFGFTESYLVQNALASDATRSDPAEIELMLEVGQATMLDVDSNGQADALTDGIIILRYLFGFTETNLIVDALGSSATRADPGVIASFLDTWTPACASPAASPVPLATSNAQIQPDLTDAIMDDFSQTDHPSMLISKSTHPEAIYTVLAYETTVSLPSTSDRSNLTQPTRMQLLATYDEWC